MQRVVSVFFVSLVLGGRMALSGLGEQFHIYDH